MLGSSPEAAAAATSRRATSACPGARASSTQCALGRRGLKSAAGPSRAASRDCSSPDSAGEWAAREVRGGCVFLV
jgi:hypothetical protein